jgi:CotH kinase protein/Secretion system C-terminal sorting domain
MKKSILLYAIFLFSFFINSECYSQNQGDNYFDAAIIHDININFIEVNWYDTLVQFKNLKDNFDSTIYLPATVIIDGTSLDSVGVRFKGNSSYYNYTSDKKPFKLDFNKFISGQKYDGLKKMNLNNMYQDPTFMREKLFLDFAQDHDLNGPRAAYCRVYVNGTYWGLYLSLDQIDKTFLDRVFGNKTGNLFKGDGIGAACANLEYHGSLNNYYDCYELKTNEVVNDWTDLVNLTDQINNTSDPQFLDSVEAVMNANSFIGAWACYSLFCNFDSYPYRFTHNYYIYDDDSSNKFEWIIWDVSTAFGNDIPWTVSQIENASIFYIWPLDTDRPLTYRMLQNTVYRQSYVNFLCQYIQDFEPSIQNAKIDSLYSAIQTDVYADTKKMYLDSEFDNNINNTISISGVDYPGLKSFIANRYASVQSELISENCSQLSFEENSENFGPVLVYPNPANGVVTIETEIKGDYQLSILNNMGQEVQETLTLKATNITLDFSRLENGIYYLVFTKDEFQRNIKLIILK